MKLKATLERAFDEHVRESSLHVIAGREKLLQRLLRALSPAETNENATGETLEKEERRQAS